MSRRPAALVRLARDARDRAPARPPDAASEYGVVANLGRMAKALRRKT